MSERRGLRAGDTLELAIEKGVYRGRGLARVDGQVVLVPRALPGDGVRARVEQAHAGWAEAALLEVVAPSPSRREPPCPHAAACGGCSYQAAAYEEQLRLKEAVLRESLRRGGAAFDGPIALTPSPERGWRTRASLHVATTPGGPVIGFREEGSRRVVPIGACLQLSSSMNGVLGAIREEASRRPDLGRRLAGVDLFESPDGTSLVATLVARARAAEAPAFAPLVRGAAGLTGHGVRGEDGVLCWLGGDSHVEAVVLGLRLRAHASSFFQGNRFLLEPLVREVLSLVPEGKAPVLDLYAGVGLFTLPLAARGATPVLAVEAAATSAEDARHNARRAGLAGVRVVEADVARALSALPPTGGEVVVLDPPRSGAGPEVVDLVAARRPPVVIYVSCDPPTLGRDLARFAARGYRPDAVRLLDLFPDTFHLETIVRLRPV